MTKAETKQQHILSLDPEIDPHSLNSLLWIDIRKNNCLLYPKIRKIEVACQKSKPKTTYEEIYSEFTERSLSFRKPPFCDSRRKSLGLQNMETSTLFQEEKY